MFSKSNLWKQIKYSLPLEYITYAKFISGLDLEMCEGSNQNHIVVFDYYRSRKQEHPKIYICLEPYGPSGISSLQFILFAIFCDKLIIKQDTRIILNQLQWMLVQKFFFQ